MKSESPKQSLNVLMISPQFKPIVGGYERACERLAVALVERGNAVTVCAEQRDKTWPQQEDMSGVEIRRWWCIYKPKFHIITSLLSLTSFLLRNGRAFDVWHAHQYGMHAALAVALGKLLRRPVVLKLTSSSYMGLANTLAVGRLPKLLAALHRRMDAIVALTRETASEAAAFGIPVERIHVLGNGLDIQAYKPIGAEERRLKKQQLGLDDSSIIIFVGRLSKEKNVSGLLHAWAMARPRIKGVWRLLVVGDGPLRSALEAEARALTLGNSAVFVGYQANIADWLAAANIFALSSDREGLSNTMLEAMATGLPVVMTHVSGADELVDKTGAGKVVSIGDMNAFSSALVGLANSDDLSREMGASGRRVVEERFAIEQVATAHQILYSTLLNKVKENHG